MNTIQKATFAASALAITLIGAALVTAPIAFAPPTTVAAVTHAGWAGVTSTARLVAFNRK
jgi:hypothetical protein